MLFCLIQLYFSFEYIYINLFDIIKNFSVGKNKVYIYDLLQVCWCFFWLQDIEVELGTLAY